MQNFFKKFESRQNSLPELSYPFDGYRQTYGFCWAHRMDYSRRGGLFMPTAQQTPAQAITVTRQFVGQQMVEALVLELIRVHTQTA